MVGRRLRRRPTIKPALGQRVVFAGACIHIKHRQGLHEMMTRRWLSVGPASQTSANHYNIF